MFSNLIFAEKPKHSMLDKHPLERVNNRKIIEQYLVDESEIIRGKAGEVVFPISEMQIAEILQEANKKKVHVTVSGAGTGLTGSRVPLDGVVLSTEKITQISFEQSSSEELIEHIELGKKYSVIIGKDEGTSEFYTITPVGIQLAIFKKLVENEGLYYPPDPTETTAVLGGTVATNASGARTFHYGSTRDYVRRLRIILPNGDVLNIKRGTVFAKQNKFTIILVNGDPVSLVLPTYTMPKVEKNAAGYYVKPNLDLIDLFIGSEGTLGVISEIEVRLVEKPKVVLPIFAHFSEEKDAVDFSRKLRSVVKAEKLNMLSIEFFCQHSTEFIRREYPLEIPEKSNGIVFFEQEASSEFEMQQTLEQTMLLLEEFNVWEANASFEPDWKRKTKEIRHALPERINNFVRSYGTQKVATDIAIQEGHLGEMIQSYQEVGSKTRVPYVIFGHIGSNHLHFNFLPKNQEEVRRSLKACKMLLKKAVRLGGTVSGEHGVGKKSYIEHGEERPYLELQYGRQGLMEIANLKHTIDSNHILNIGNLVPVEYLEQISV